MKRISSSTSSAYHFSWNMRVDVLLRRERNQIVDALADADVANRQLEIVRDGDRYAALRGPIELREHDAGDTGDAGELARLLDAVLTDRGVEHEQHLVRRALGGACRDAANLVELVHQVDAVVQAAGGIDEDRIASARFAGLNRVEHDRRRIGAVLGADDIDVGALRPRSRAARPPRRGTCRRRRRAAAALRPSAGWPACRRSWSCRCRSRRR